MYDHGRLMDITLLQLFELASDDLFKVNSDDFCVNDVCEPNMSMMRCEQLIDEFVISN